MFADVRFAVRLLVKSPLYTATAIFILAIAIAGNTAAFSALNVLVLQRLPFQDAKRLVVLASAERSTGARAGVSFPDYQDWTRGTTFESAAAVELEQTFNIGGPLEPIRVSGGRMTATLLPVLGVRPARGRSILPSDERPGAPPVVLITHRFWESAFNREDSAVGREILVDGLHATIVGVLPPDFRLLYGGYSIWAPLARADATDRRHRSLLAIARIPPGVSPASAATSLAAVTTRLEREYPSTNQGWRARVRPMRDFLLTGRGNTLVFVMVALGLLLLVACANVASLQLARGSARHGEIAMRLALGASRARIVRLLLVEAGMIAVLSGGAALLLVAAARRILLATTPDLRELAISMPVLAFTLAATCVTAIAFGLVPALTATRMELAAAIKGNVAAQRSTRRLRSALVIAELSLTLVLLVPAGLLFKSFLALRQMEPGFRVTNLLTLSIALPRTTYASPAQQAAFADDALAQLEGIPGVIGASAGDSLPLDVPPAIDVRAPGARAGEGAIARAAIRSVTPGYLRTLDIPLRAGRNFTAGDDAAAPAVAIVNETLAAALRPDRQVAGERLETGDGRAVTIVGVAADVRSVGLRTPPQAEILVPFDQQPRSAISIAMATEGNASQYIPAVRERMRSLDRDLPLADVRPMATIVKEQTAALRAIAALLGALAALALLLATAGLSGIMSWLVTQRTHEIGVRTALGATRRDVVALILRDALVLVLSGVALGVPAAALVARLVSSMLWGVGATDIVVFIVVPATLILAAAAAGYVPARRATRLDPIAILRRG